MENFTLTDFLSILSFIVIPALTLGLVYLSCLPLQSKNQNKPLTGRLWTSEMVYFSNILVLALIAQYPHIMQNFQVSHPDEPAMISQAYTLLKDPIYYRSVDGGSNGPFNSYILSVFLALGFPFQYTTARVVTILLGIGSTWFLYRAACVLGCTRFARLGILPAFLFFIFQQNYELYQYTSHHMPIFLIAVCIWLMARTATKNVTSDSAYAALVLGTIPFSKLQYSVMGVYLGAVLILIVYLRSDGNFLNRVIKISFVILSSLAIPLFLILTFYFFGVLNDAYIRYIASNLFYASIGPVPVSESLSRFYQDYSFWGTGGFKYIFRASLVISFVATILNICLIRSVNKNVILAIILSWIFLLISAYSASAPMRPFPHYVLVCIPAMAFLLCLCLSNLYAAIPGKSSGIILTLVVLITCGWSFNAEFTDRMKNRYPPSAELVASSIHPAATEALKFAGKGDSLAIWGYRPGLFLQTGMFQGTRENVSYYQIIPNPYIKYYRTKFLEDIKTNKPEVFMDVVGKSNWDYSDRGVYGMQTFPALLHHIQLNYIEVANIEEVRIFILKERYIERVNKNYDLMPFKALPVAPVTIKSKYLIMNDVNQKTMLLHSPGLIELPVSQSVRNISFKASLNTACPGGASSGDGVRFKFGIRNQSKLIWIQTHTELNPATNLSADITVELPSGINQESLFVILINSNKNEICDQIWLSEMNFNNDSALRTQLP